ncbi:nucleotide pyrophosphohydrolase, partial [bacterium]|nr:nucleotide pyrophosphohydrolase [bacterium]
SEHLETKRSEVADELSDVLYWVILMANDLDIDLNKALSDKMDKNEAKYPVEKARGNHKKYTELDPQ